MKKEEIDLSVLGDEKLMIRIRKDDPDAFEELYHRYSSRVLNFLYRLWSRDEETAQDLLQDTFMRIIDKADFFDETKRFSTWLFTIASNLSKNELRRKGIRRDKLRIISDELTSSYESDIDQVLDKKHIVKGLNREIERLEPVNRELIELRFHEEMSVSQIAVIMEIPEGTVKSRLHHLVKGLTKKLNKYIDQ